MGGYSLRAGYATSEAPGYARVCQGIESPSTRVCRVRLLKYGIPGSLKIPGGAGYACLQIPGYVRFAGYVFQKHEESAYTGYVGYSRALHLQTGVQPVCKYCLFPNTRYDRASTLPHRLPEGYFAGHCGINCNVSRCERFRWLDNLPNGCANAHNVRTT